MDAILADAEPPFEQRLRAEGAHYPDVQRGDHNPPDAEAAAWEVLTFTKQALRGSLANSQSGADENQEPHTAPANLRSMSRLIAP